MAGHIIRSGRVRLLAIVLIVLSLSLIGRSVFVLPQGHIAKGVRVGPVALGGMSRQQAVVALQQLEGTLQSQPVVLGHGDLEFRLDPKDLAFGLDVQAIVEQAYNWGREGPPDQRLIRRWQARFNEIKLPLKYRYDGGALNRWLKEVAARFEKDHRDAEIRPSPIGKGLDIKNEIEGSRLLYPQTKEVVENLLTSTEKRRGNPVLKSVKPRLTRAGIKSLGISDLISWYATRFDASNVNRAHNIQVTASVLNNLILLPGEKFSFINTVHRAIYQGDFKEAPVIIDNEFVTGVGGGICQVSTTLYNAAVLANLKILERNHHSLPVGYVPLGFDAAVADDYLDLKLQNTRSGAVLITSQVEGGRITLMVFGKKLDGEKIYTQSSDQEVIPPETVRKTEPSWPAGAKVREEGRPGYRITTWRIVKGPGGQRREVLTRDFYKPVPHKIIVGTGGR